MEHYLGIPVKRGLHRSPLREDARPTCAFYRNNRGDLIFKDFGNGFSGNFISVVMCKFGCSFYMALQIIANDFGIIKRDNMEQNVTKIKYTNTVFDETKSAIIQVQIREFQQYELNYWGHYGINPSTLKKFKVYSAQNVFLNGNLFTYERDNQLVFGYYGGIKSGIEQWRIYYPEKRKYRFISNWKSTQLQGAAQLPKEGGDYLVITKSLKDVMALYEFNIPAIAPISENVFVTEIQYKKLLSKFKNIILLYDNDLPGISSANKIRKNFSDVLVTYIPRRYHVKDFSDFRKKYGRQKTLGLIEEFKMSICGENKERRNRDSTNREENENSFNSVLKN